MNDRNEMSMSSFIISNIFWSAVWTFNYYISIFLRWPNHPTRSSQIIFFSLVVSCMIVGIAMTCNRRRNDTSTVINVLLPLEIYAFVTYYVFYKREIIVLGGISVILACVFSIFVFYRNRRKNDGHTVPIWKKIRHCLLGSRTIIVCCMATLLVVILFSFFRGDGLLTSKDTLAETSAPDSVSDDIWTISNNIDSIMLLEEDKWESLGLQDKMNVLGIVKNIEIRYLGINHDITLVCNAAGKSTAASYREDCTLITLDASELATGSAHELLNSVCHECYHAYQHQLVALYEDTPEEYHDMPFFARAVVYSDEFENYDDGNDDYYGYYAQQVEMDCREYAEDAVEDYYSKIEMHKTYLETTN